MVRSSNRSLTAELYTASNASSTVIIEFTTNYVIEEFVLAITDEGDEVELTEEEIEAGVIAKVVNDYYSISLIDEGTKFIRRLSVSAYTKNSVPRLPAYCA